MPIRYLSKKLFYLLISFFIIVSLTFFLMKAIPGDPFADEMSLPPEIMHALKEHYGLNDPWYKQYANYLKSVVTWDFGPSFKYKGRSVNAIIREGFPISAVLGLEALFLAVSMGVFLGSVAALYQNRWQDHIAMFIAVLGISIPSFILATLLQYLFALKLGLFPVARFTSFAHTILPAISLAALPTAFIARLTRSNMLEVLQQDFIKTAKAKGLPKWKIITNHALRNALLPIITYLGQLTVNILVGSFIIERIFGIPGLGQWFVMSVANRDYTAIMGTTVFYSILLLSSMFIVDIVYSLLDPRIQTRRS